MKHLEANMKKYIRIYILFFKNSLALLASHRFNLLMSALGNIVWTAGQVISLNFIFGKVQDFQGWSINDMILLLGFGQLFVYLMFILYWDNHATVQAKIVAGELETYLTKPINLKFFLSFENVSIAQLIPFIVAVIPLIAIGIRDLRAVGITDIIFCILVLIVGSIIIFFLNLILAGLNFYTDDATSIRDMVMNTTDMSRIPLTFFPGPLQLVFVFFIPLAFVTYYPALILKEPQNMLLILFVEILVLIIFYLISKLVWKKGLERYTGAA